jgi:predicted acyl esterase
MSIRNLSATLAFALVPAISAPAFSQKVDPVRLAQNLLTVYQDSNRETYLDNRMRAHVVVGDYAAALATADTLKELRSANANGLPAIVSFAYELYAKARLDGSIDTAFVRLAQRIDDKTAAHALRYAVTTSVAWIKADYAATLGRLEKKEHLSVADMVDIVRRYAGLVANEFIAPHVARLLDADDERRYIITRDIRIASPKEGVVCVFVFRPRNAQGKLPALLNFTIYESDVNTVEARRSASNGYVGVAGLTRGKGCSTNEPVSHEFDGIDAAAVIDWIAAQPWSDGRVGTYGGSYEGMTQWAAAKHMPKALKAMMTSVTHAPGIDFPIDGNIFATYAYPWPFYTTNQKGLDQAMYNDSARWGRMQREWYRSGRAYRDLPLIDGTPNPTFLRWLAHPSYDDYWQSMVAAGTDFARIDIPVLTTTGYFDSGQMGALWFYREHIKHRAAAEHYLLIGPYDHTTGQRGNMDPLGRRWQRSIQGYHVEDGASLDVGELRYKWFDYIFKGKPKPELLGDKVNYFVMNGNAWKHAPSITAMHDTLATIRMHANLVQIINLADRSDAEAWGSSGDLLDPSSSVRNVVDTTTNIANAVMFESEPFDSAVEVSGLFSASLDFVTNKKDFDLSVTVFELTGDGTYIQLSYHWQRASYAYDRARRTLIVPGKRTHISFTNNRLMSKRLWPGSRIVVVLAIPKNPSQQINYGTGKVVADETIADAGAPLRIEWLATSSVSVPIRRNRH